MKIKMKLLSDAIPYTGEGATGIIDIDISYDKFGLPFIPSKRIKGVLRESAQNLVDVGILERFVIDKIFGKRGKQSSCEFKISDGYLINQKEYLALLNYSTNDNDLKMIFNKSVVLDYFSYLRTNTTIDTNGVAKENSLRTMRVLKKDLEFEFEFVLENNLVEDFKKILKVTRFYGLSRTRGFGNIELSYINYESNTNDKSINNMITSKIDISLKNESLLFVSNKINVNQKSENYVSGSFLLGAFASKYIKAKKLEEPHKDQTFRDIFLEGKVQFNNLYPEHNDQIFYPCSEALTIKKDSDTIFDLSHKTDIDEIKMKNVQTKGKPGSFIKIEEDDLYSIDVDTEITYHHARSEDRGIGKASEKDGDFFQFESISKNQHFKGSITGDKSLLKELTSTLKDDKYIYLGKSATAQYGKCEFEANFAEDDKNSITWENGDNLAITLESDLVLRNKSGLYSTDISQFIDEFAKQINIPAEKITIDEDTISSLKFSTIGGYLSVWNMPKIQIPVISAGSTILLINNSGTNIEINETEKLLFGLKNEEGYGKVKFNWHQETEEMTLKESEKDDIYLSNNLLAIDDFIKSVLLEKIKLNLKEKAYKENGSIRNPHQVGRLNLLIRTSSSFEDLNRKLKDLKKKSKDSFSTIKKNLYFSSDIQVDSKRFTNDLKQLNPTSKYSKIRDNILSDETFYLKNDKVFELYQIYAITLLNKIKFDLRRNKTNGGGND